MYLIDVHTTLRNTLSLLLALCVLLGSAGITLSEQTCLMTGRGKVVILAHNDGCCERREAATEEDSCCTQEVTFAKLETVLTQKALAVALPVLSHAEVKPVFFQRFSTLATDQRLLTYSDPSPPLYGCRLLHRLQVLQI